LAVKTKKPSGVLSSKLLARLSAVICLAGVVMIIVSFDINPGAPTNATPAQVIAYGQANYAAVFWGAWLQALGSIFIIAFGFAIALLAVAGGKSKWAAIMTFLGGIALIIVDLTEVWGYLSALNSTVATVQARVDFIHAVQHLYFIPAAPLVFIPLGFAVLKSRLLPRTLGYLSLLLGVAFAALGVAFFSTSILPPAVQAFAGVQALWWVAAAIIILVRADRVVS
jgi:hypothetical protein